MSPEPPGFGDRFVLTLISNDPALAARADAAGVNRIGVDLEYLGKAQRQAGTDSRLSAHSIADLAAIAATRQSAETFVRINPLNPDSPAEIESVLHHDAQCIMLPYFHGAGEVAEFVGLVAGRARTILLLETKGALDQIDTILAVAGVDEIMAGLNDLRLQLGLSSHFQVLASPVMTELAARVTATGLPFSIGGVARPDDQSLPVSADLIIAQYPRLNATGAWLSRSFFRHTPAPWDMRPALKALRRRLTYWSNATPDELSAAHQHLADLVAHF